MPDTEPRRWRMHCPSPISGRTVIADIRIDGPNIRIDGPNYTFTCPCHGITAHGLVVDVPEADKHAGSRRGRTAMASWVGKDRTRNMIAVAVLLFVLGTASLLVALGVR